MSPKRKYPPTLFFTGLMVSLGRGLFSFPLTLAGSFIVFFFGCLGSRSRAWDYGILFVLFLCGLVKVVYATKRDRLKGFFALLSVVDLAAAAALVSPYLPSVSHWAALIVLGLWLLPALSRQLLFMIVALTPGDDPEVEEFLDMMFDPDNPEAAKKWHEKGAGEIDRILRRADPKHKAKDPAPYLPTDAEDEEDFFADAEDFEDEDVSDGKDGKADKK